jgi:hypothetical protein
MNLVPVGNSKELPLFEGDGIHLVDTGTIGRLLYPRHKNPAKMVRKIYERNKEHFTDQETMLIEVETSYFWSPDGQDMKDQFDPACPPDFRVTGQDMERQFDAPCPPDFRADGQDMHPQNGGACPPNFRVTGRDMRAQFGPACLPQQASVRKQKVRFFSLPMGMIKTCKFSRSPYAVEAIERIVDHWERYRFGAMLKSLSSQQPIAVTGPYIKDIQRIMGRTKGKTIVRALFEGTFDYNDYFMTLEEISRMPDGSARYAAVAKEAQRSGRSLQTVYRNVDMVRRALGLQCITRKGVPRRTRSEAGSHRKRPEYQQAMDYRREHPKAGGAEIRQACGLTVSASRVNNWLREGISIH